LQACDKTYLVVHRIAWQRAILTVAAALLLASAAPQRAFAQSAPAWNIRVGGEAVTLRDVGQAMILVFTARRGQPASKDPKEMPSFAPYTWYGVDSSGTPALWFSTATPNLKSASTEVFVEVSREGTAAGVLIALVEGQGGPLWQRLFHAVPDEPKARNDFAREITTAFRYASDWTVAQSAANRKWLFTNIRAGLNRQQVYTLLKARGLRASKALDVPPEPPSNSDVVELPGEFEPGCSFSNHVTITFDATDHVKKLDLSPPIPNCL
jgi:hypothetical protein